VPKRGRKARGRTPAPTAVYVDREGNELTLRQSLSVRTIAKIREGPSSSAATVDDVWRRRSEMLFERLAVRWEIAGLPLTEQKMLLGRYRLADRATQQWVDRTIAEHIRRYLPELADD
jgi:hypothetical protein